MPTHARPTATVVVLAATDSLLRDVALMTALVDAPHVSAIVHDLDEDEDGQFSLRRKVFDGTIHLEQAVRRLEHPCAGCAMREDAVPAIAEAIARGATAIVLGLPLGAEILPATRSLLEHSAPGRFLEGIRLGLTVAVCSGSTVPAQLADGDEDLLAQLVGADVLVVDDGLQDPVGSDLIDAVRWADSARYDDLCDPWLPLSLLADHDDRELERRCDPLTVERGATIDGARRAADGAMVAPSGVWVLDLRSARPVNAHRLLALGEALAPENVVSTGRFSTPHRPGWVCGWDGVGGSVAVGLAGPGDPGTRLVFAGTGDRQGIIDAFHEALLTGPELQMSPQQWKAFSDPLQHFLDPNTETDAA